MYSYVCTFIKLVYNKKGPKKEIMATAGPVVFYYMRQDTSLKSKLAKKIFERKEPHVLKALDLGISKMTWKLV